VRLVSVLLRLVVVIWAVTQTLSKFVCNFLAMDGVRLPTVAPVWEKHSMTLDRREFVQAGAAFAAGVMVSRTAMAARAFNPKPGAWRSFEIVTRLAIDNPESKVQAWIPMPAVNEQAWFRTLESTWTTNATSAALVSDPNSGAALLHATWADDEQTAVIAVTSRASTRDRAVDFASPSEAGLSAADRERYTAGTRLIPVDGIVKETADKIVAGSKTDLDKARAIYNWVVDNTFRDPNTRGCGVGDVAAMLKTGNLGGKCADLNALFVGLARASGIPARDVYGIRVAPSKFGYQSLGANSEVITHAQHCRAEAFLNGYGWIAIDPADVRKVVLEEPPGSLPLTDKTVADARKTLFGAWEGNWIAYNMGGDIALVGSSGPRLNFLMYPQAEVASRRLDCLDPENFTYSITSRELIGT
jgi:transglutaminase-like putative cysteine protease